ncbi:accessory regulator AgrB [Acinetobacter sp. CUI P1]|nr:accessory regulator AgrB [Acinetobacter sp. CUI P1]
MIEFVAGRMAEGIKHRAPDHPASLAVLKHALAVLINTVSIITFSLVAATVTGHLKETVTILISFAMLRMVSGGLHLKTGSMCVLVTTSLFFAISYVDFNARGILVLNIASVILALLFAPSGIEKQSRIPPKYYPLLKVVSVLMISSNFLIGSSTIAACFFVQALTLISRKEVKS